MDFTNIISLLGGVACFLFGMSVMGDSLKKVAGSKMEMVLYKLAGNPVKGILLGTGVTAVIQSSSATSVMVVGFVNSGMMKVRQAIGVVLGAILGTSITGWILALNSIGGGSSVASYFSTEVLTGVVALIGIILWMFAKKTSSKNVGGIMMGFAVLMYGMSMMSGSIAPLREDPKFIDMLTSFSNPYPGCTCRSPDHRSDPERKCCCRYSSGTCHDRSCTVRHGVPDPDGYRNRCICTGNAQCSRSQHQRQENSLCISDHRCTRSGYSRIDLLHSQRNCGVQLHADNDDHGRSRFYQHYVQTGCRDNPVAPAIGLLEKIVIAMFPESEEAAAEQADMDRLESRFLNHPALAIAQSRTVIDSMAEKTLESVRGGFGCKTGIQQDRSQEST